MNEWPTSYNATPPDDQEYIWSGLRWVLASDVEAFVDDVEGNAVFKWREHE